MISEKIRKLNQQELRTTTEKIVVHKRKVEAVFIEHLAEIIRRKAFVHWQFTSVYDYLTRELKFSGSAAYRRIQAAQVLLQIPEIKTVIETGALNLSQICSAQVALKQEQKNKGPVPITEKLELFSEIRNKTARETEKIIDQKYELASFPFPVEKHKHDDSVELSLRLPKDVFAQLQKVKELYSHLIPDGNWIEVLKQMSQDVIQKRDASLKKKLRKQSDTGVSAPTRKASLFEANNKSQGLRTSIKKFIFRRDQVCQHKHKDGTTCGSRYQLEVDHIQPRFADGDNQIGNLRLLCRVHNQARYRMGR